MPVWGCTRTVPGSKPTPSYVATGHTAAGHQGQHSPRCLALSKYGLQHDGGACQQAQPLPQAHSADCRTSPEPVHSIQPCNLSVQFTTAQQGCQHIEPYRHWRGAAHCSRSKELSRAPGLQAQPILHWHRLRCSMEAQLPKVVCLCTGTKCKAAWHRDAQGALAAGARC